MRKIAALVLLVVAGSAFAACGGGGHGSMSDAEHVEENAPVVEGAMEIDVSGDSYRFGPDSIEVAAGTDVTIALTATDLPHDFTVKKVGHVVHAERGKTARGGLKITKPGTYEIYCSVKGHRAEGMTGTLVVS